MPLNKKKKEEKKKGTRNKMFVMIWNSAQKTMFWTELSVL